MSGKNKSQEIEAIKSRLIALGAKVTVDKTRDVVIVRFELTKHICSHWIEVGFLIGQWAFLAGIEYPRDFPRSTITLGDKLRFDVDPGGMSFTINC